MKTIFSSLYEWFGMNCFYSADMGEYLNGWDITCSNYVGTPWYMIVGWTMLAIVIAIYILQYHIIDSSAFSKKRHWWVFSLVIVALNFFVGFVIPFKAINESNFCKQLTLTVSDCIGFGISNAIWSFLLFLLITTIPLIRKFSTNCRQTTFWKP